MSKSKPQPDHSIAVNKKARHDYFIIEQMEAGLVLEGWEVKSLRTKSIQLKESYVLIRGMQAWLLGAHINPLATTSTHKVADPTRTRKLLLHRDEIAKLVGAVERKGYTLIPLSDVLEKWSRQAWHCCSKRQAKAGPARKHQGAGLETRQTAAYEKRKVGPARHPMKGRGDILVTVRRS